MLLRRSGHDIAMRLTMLAPCSSCASFLYDLDAQAPRSCLSWSQGKLCCGMRHVVERVVSKVCLVPQHNFPCDHDTHERGACVLR